MQILHPPQKPERPLLWNGCSYGIKNYGVRVIFNGITFLQNFTKLYQMDKKLIAGQTHRQDGDLISLHLSFRKVSWLKQYAWVHTSMYRCVGAPYMFCFWSDQN
jgi:hypothetical protein